MIQRRNVGAVQSLMRQPPGCTALAPFSQILTQKIQTRDQVATDEESDVTRGVLSKNCAVSLYSTHRESSAWRSDPGKRAHWIFCVTGPAALLDEDSVVSIEEGGDKKAALSGRCAWPVEGCACRPQRHCLPNRQRLEGTCTSLAVGACLCHPAPTYGGYLFAPSIQLAAPPKMGKFFPSSHLQPVDSVAPQKSLMQP
jgi:hypothetical protein